MMKNAFLSLPWGPDPIRERTLYCNVADTDSYVFGHPGSGSISTRYGSFYNQAKIVRKTLIPTL